MAKGLRIRKWLNRAGHHSTAFVYASHDGRWGELTISDCGRQVTLSLEANDKGSHSNTVFKLRTLEDAVRQVRELIEARDGI